MTAPDELRESGRSLWESVTDVYELEEHERGLLLEMCRTVDSLDRLAEILADDGEIIEDRFGAKRAHPALVEARQLRIAYARISAALRLPSGEDDDPDALRRPQRRVGTRGVYGVAS